jgi:hypothetical protein
MFQERALKYRRKFKLPAWVGPVLKVAVYAVPFAFMCVSIGLASLAVKKDADQTAAATKAFLADTQGQVHQLGQSSNRVLVEAGLTAMEARKAAKFQNAFWQLQAPVLVARANSTFDKTDAFLGSLTHTSNDLDTDLNTTTQAIVDTQKSLKPALEAGTAALTATAGVANAASKDLADPSIPATLKDTAEATHQLAAAATSGAHVADNIDHKVDSMVHPTKWGKVKNALFFGLEVAKDLVESRYYLEAIP